MQSANFEIIFFCPPYQDPIRFVNQVTDTEQREIWYSHFGKRWRKGHERRFIRVFCF